MKKILFLLVCIIGMQAVAQQKLRITMSDGTQMDFCVNNIEEMSFQVREPLNIVGEWVCYQDVYGGVIICYAFNEDGTVVYKERYLNPALSSYSSEYSGTYSMDGNVVSMNLFDTVHIIETVGYTETELHASTGIVMYKVREPIYKMNSSDEPIIIGEEGDSIIYTDCYCVKAIDNKIAAVRAGDGYALVEDAETKEIKAYRIEVSAVVNVIDWAKFLKKNKDDIIAEFGEPNQINEDKSTFSYTAGYDDAVKMIIFTHDTDNNIISVQISLYDAEKKQIYLEDIEKKYIYNRGSDTSIVYYDTDSRKTATIQITVYMSMDMIVYKSL